VTASITAGTAGFLADGRVVVAAGKRLRVYAPDRNTILADLELPTRVRSLRASPDGLRLLTVPSYLDKAPPVLWDLEHYRLIPQPEDNAGRVFTARFVGDGHEILTAGGNGTARLWDGTTGQLRQVYRGNSRFFADATLTPDGSMVVAGDADGLLRFWDAPSGRPLWRLPAHKSHVIGIHFEGDDIVTRGFTGEISRWTLPKPAAVIAACGLGGEVVAVDGGPCAIVSR
jgi:WD40 repeat protein